MQNQQNIPIALDALSSEVNDQRKWSGLPVEFHKQREYMTTKEAAAYLRKSVSWLLRIGDIAYLPGKPNMYSRRDLDDWYERNKHVPRMLMQ